MDPKLFEVLGKYAGLAGFSIGLILLVSMQILRNIKGAKALDNNQNYSLLKTLMYLTFGIGVVGILAWAFVNHKPNPGPGPVSSITGHVTDHDSKKPVGDAELTLSGRTEMARTDGAGNFALIIPNPPPPSTQLHLYIAKDDYETFDRGVVLGQNLEAELISSKPKTAGTPKVEMENEPDVYYSDVTASGSCGDMGAWASVCTPEKPASWTLTYQKFSITGDRAGGAYAESHNKPTAVPGQVCYEFRTQGHNEECGHSGNTGIHFSKGQIDVVWSRPKN